ncbi:sigma-70 family RNA polymerase sigma factor [Methylobacterium sp. Leaf102]|uniref:RNA polymerase sigma factor n=1 Tax=Methylobacterium sp. Leaf102 TaxID=1736253 RepID=UPI000A632983|nr:sigma-70 family RNA polymerase sigma factor [Methylobacterium sp. Leaf102]
MMSLEHTGEGQPYAASLGGRARPFDRSLQLDYPKYRRLLMGALARLARNGYAVPPDEGLDLIHDFFVEAWEGLLDRFDPGQVKFETYVFGAFVRFSRPRIVRLSRLRDGLLEPRALAALDVADADMDDRATDADMMAIGRAIGRLPPAERALLAAYVGDDEPSERSLAHELGISRYDLRLKLADALGRLTVELGEVGALDVRVAAVAEMLWRDNLNVKEAAGVLCLSTSEVQAARSVLFTQLSRAVKGERTMTVQNHVPRLPPEASSSHPQSLITAALGRAATSADFAALRENAEAVWAFLDGPSGAALLAEAGVLENRQVEEFYGALAGESMPLDDDPDYNAFIQASILDEEQIGDAFAQAMVDNLGPKLNDFGGGLFSGAPRVDAKLYKRLMREPSVVTGGPHASVLAEFGITPSSIMEATRAISNLAMRTCREEGIERDQAIFLSRAGMAGNGDAQPKLRRKTGATEVELATGLPSVTSERLFDWLCEVAVLVPLLFDGFEASPQGGEVRLRRTDVAEGDLYRRLRPSPHTSPRTDVAA